MPMVGLISFWENRHAIAIAIVMSGIAGRRLAACQKPARDNRYIRTRP